MTAAAVGNIFVCAPLKHALVKAVPGAAALLSHPLVTLLEASLKLMAGSLGIH